MCIFILGSLPHHTWKTWAHGNSSNPLAYKATKKGPNPYIPLDSLFEPSGTLLLDPEHCEEASKTAEATCTKWQSLSDIVDRRRWQGKCDATIDDPSVGKAITKVSVMGKPKFKLGFPPVGIDTEPNVKYQGPVISKVRNLGSAGRPCHWFRPCQKVRLWLQKCSFSIYIICQSPLGV
jgi:hypothetical protein